MVVIIYCYIDCQDKATTWYYYSTQLMLLRDMYLCMVITYSKRMNQPGKAANPARGQLNREK